MLMWNAVLSIVGRRSGVADAPDEKDCGLVRKGARVVMARVERGGTDL
jgi:hypothetical protein